MCSLLSFYFVFFCFIYIFILFCFFFFQAEDGIRDRDVTGVQTCALPIWRADTGSLIPRQNRARRNFPSPVPALRYPLPAETFAPARVPSRCELCRHSSRR